MRNSLLESTMQELQAAIVMLNRVKENTYHMKRTNILRDEKDVKALKIGATEAESHAATIWLIADEFWLCGKPVTKEMAEKLN
jgi:hypothetical protein